MHIELNYAQCWTSKGRDHKLYEVWPKRKRGLFVFVCVGGVRVEYDKHCGGWGWKKEGKMNDGYLEGCIEDGEEI